MNLLTSSLSTSFSVPSSPSWAHGGMVTDATISDETDKGIGLDSIANHRGETAWQTEECRIPPFMHPSVSLICDALKDSFLRYIGFSENILKFNAEKLYISSFLCIIAKELRI